MAGPKGRKRAGRALGILLALGVSIALIAILSQAAIRALDKAPQAGAGLKPALFVVKHWSSASQVAYALEDARLIRSAAFFIAYLRWTGDSSRLQAGSYELAPGSSARAIAKMMVEGKQALRRVTVPEGYTLKDIATLLEGEGVCGRDAFIAAASNPVILQQYGIEFKSAEGYLFPDTYDFPIQTEAANVMRSMLSNFFATLKREVPEALDLTKAELASRVIVASIVEREYRDPEEAPRIASVFFNRLKLGMGLQSCATVVYIITDIQGLPHPKEITVRDLAMDNPYNTYRWAGLPPGPISNPGLVSIRAAIRPEKTDYYYFRLTDPVNGRHTFTRNLNEHIGAGNLSVKGKTSR
jgi:UPF0755 protein